MKKSKKSLISAVTALGTVASVVAPATTALADTTNGWALNGQSWTYYTNGQMVKNGWVQDSGKWYLMGADGTMVTGWAVVGGVWYYMGANGAMVSNGWAQDSAKNWYFMGANGAMVTSGWAQDSTSKKWYYMADNGVMEVNKWIVSGGFNYYMGATGSMLTDAVTPDGYRVLANGTWDGLGKVTSKMIVESVKTINGAQLQVKFNRAVKKSTVITEVSDVDKLKDGVITVSKVEGNGTVAINNTSLATLSEDGKTLTITAATGAFDDMKYVVNVDADTIKGIDDIYVEKFTSNVISATDDSAPVLASVEKLTSSKFRVKFSEPLSNGGSWSFELANGDAVVVTPDVGDIAEGYVDLTVDSGVDAGKVITATAISVKDYAGNLLSPNPLKVNFTKGQLDGTKPTVSSLTSTGLDTMEIKFSEEVTGFEKTDITGVTVNKLTKDSTDKTKYTLEITAVTEGLHAISIAADAISDLSGEKIKEYNKVVEFKEDSKAPSLVKSEIKKDEDGFEFLHLTFDEAITKGTLTALSTSKVKDYVTTSDDMNLSGLAVVADTSNKELKVKLDDVTFDGAKLEKGAVYTVTLTEAFTDGTNKLGTTKITFVRGTDSLTAAQEVFAVAQTTEKPSEVKVTFTQEVDGATATNVANYNINGVVVEKAEIRSGESSVVYLTLASGSNTLTGDRTVTVNRVKTKDGVAMKKAYSGVVALDENVAPTFTATLTDAKTITLKFSEKVTDVTDAADEADFKVLIDGEDVTGFTPAVNVTEAGTDGGKEYTLTLSRDLTAAEYGKSITIKATDDLNIIDAKKNELDFTSVTVSK